MQAMYKKFKILYSFSAAQPYSVIMFFALLCTLLVKFCHASRTGLLGEYFFWVLSDISLLLCLEIVLVYVCYRWRKRWVIRAATIFAAIICFWSFLNAGWIIRSGSQILPTVLLPLFRDPLNSLLIIGVNMLKMPVASLFLLVPGAAAIVFFVSVLVRPRFANHSLKWIRGRVVVSCVIILGLIFVRVLFNVGLVGHISSQEFVYNSHIRAVANIFSLVSRHNGSTEFSEPRCHLPGSQELELVLGGNNSKQYNVVIVVLEGIQYRYTSLWNKGSGQTPFFSKLASEGVEFSNMRSSVTHTTKALFSLLTGRYPSISQDIAEAVPAVEPYGSLVTILQNECGYRTAFFQSAKGDFECRPGLVHNLGFDDFYSREDVAEPNEYIGYLGSDEFSMLRPILKWIKADSRPFLLTLMCSVSHDPYVVPQWYGEPAQKLRQRYRQCISYTDDFISQLNEELLKLGLWPNTIFCVVGDHGEAFGEHGMLGHERIGFDESLRIPFIIRCPGLLSAGREVTKPVSSVDVTPTLLGLLGFQTKATGFDGVDAILDIPDERKIYFSGWLEESPLGMVLGERKYIYNPMNREVYTYHLRSDPFERMRIKVEGQVGDQIAEEILNWRRRSVFKIRQKPKGEKVLYKQWRCYWTDRVSSAEYLGRLD